MVHVHRLTVGRCNSTSNIYMYNLISFYVFIQLFSVANRNKHIFILYPFFLIKAAEPQVN